MSAFLEGLAEIFDVDASELGPDTSLSEYNWDSLSIVSTIALADEVFSVMLDGSALAKCETIKDIEALVVAVQ